MFAASIVLAGLAECSRRSAQTMVWSKQQQTEFAIQHDWRLFAQISVYRYKPRGLKLEHGLSIAIILAAGRWISQKCLI